jgi:hypothetical protein
MTVNDLLRLWFQVSGVSLWSLVTGHSSPDFVSSTPDACELILDSGYSMLDKEYQTIRNQYPESSIQYLNVRNLKPACPPKHS